ncbi:unnamed protein product [Strongylus vulgaris]|uniref:Uncharacterized protein n=1 Tax=Strongylus vulgaris TaxID=40348 RepID=A0A3P7J6T0_STRVU|nr:unnamed protein product [Strongylus vulgaris]
MYPAPICGQINDIHTQILEKEVALGERDFSLTLNITFDPIVRENELPTIYYKAFYGEAQPYPRKEEVHIRLMAKYFRIILHSMSLPPNFFRRRL